MKGFCIDVKTTLERYSDQLYLLSVSVTDGHPKASLPSAGQLQLRPDAKVGFLQAVPRRVFAVVTPFFLWLYVKRAHPLSGHGFASQGVILGQMITKSAGNHAASLPLASTETWWWTSTTYTDVAVH